MVLILDGNSDIGAHVGSNICYSISLRNSMRSRAVKNRFFFLRIIPIFLHACATCFVLPSNISTIAGDTAYLVFFRKTAEF